MIRGAAALAAMVAATGYFSGMFAPAGYSRTVERPPAQVMAALEALDLTAQPGAPGSTAEAAGGVKPLFRLVKSADKMTWYVMSGDKVATAMTASFEPLDGGKETRIRTNVQRGDAPDDFVSPAFRSRGLTMALFGMAIEGQVDRLVAPAPADPATCQRLIEGMAGSPPLTAGPAHPQGFVQGMAAGATTIMRLNAMEAELRRNGCNTNADGSFRPLDAQMQTADGEDSKPMMGTAKFVPGKPMLDPRPSR